MSKELDPIMAEAMLASLASINLANLLKIPDTKLRFNMIFEETPLQIDIRFQTNQILVRIKVVENGD